MQHSELIITCFKLLHNCIVTDPEHTNSFTVVLIKHILRVEQHKQYSLHQQTFLDLTLCGNRLRWKSNQRSISTKLLIKMYCVKRGIESGQFHLQHWKRFAPGALRR
jgi:hypothetical protein